MILIAKDIQDKINTPLIETDEECPIHHVKLRKHPTINVPAECPICERERLEKQNKEKAKQAELEVLRATHYNWLKERCLFTDLSLLDVSFETSEVSNGEMRENYKKAWKYALEVEQGVSDNLILGGRTGAGKSHLAMCILNKINEDKKPFKRCLFISLDEMMRQIKNSIGSTDPKDKHTKADIEELIIKADVVVLDDLGAEIGLLNDRSQASNFTGTTLTSILNGRQNKPTIFTTNLTTSQIEDKYDARISSRIKRNRRTLNFTGADLREQEKGW